MNAQTQTAYKLPFTAAQRSALKWLITRNADGVFDKHQVLVARGEKAPVMRSTWNALAAHGLVEPYMKNRRLKVTDNGHRVDLSKVEESE